MMRVPLGVGVDPREVLACHFDVLCQVPGLHFVRLLVLAIL